MLQIPVEQIVERIRYDNPWWQPPHQIDSQLDAYQRRDYVAGFKHLITESTVRRAVVLMGPRRIGKTVLIHHMIADLLKSGALPKRICYVSVDTPTYSGIPLERLFEFFRQANDIKDAKGFYVFFDEIQYLRDWHVHLKSLVDSYPGNRFIVSGSAAAALSRQSCESGAGRFTEFLLPPLTFAEFRRLSGKATHPLEHWPENANANFRQDDLTTIRSAIEQLNREFLDYLDFGGYPEVITTPRIREHPERYIRSDILDKVLLRDLPGLYGIQDTQELNALFSALAYQTAQEVSLEALAQKSGVAKNTIRRYLEYLEAAFLIRVVHRVDRTANRFRRANAFKVYLTNPSLRCALFGPAADDEQTIGRLVENAIVAQYFQTPYGVHYARWKSGARWDEVDLVLLSADMSVSSACEVKWSDAQVRQFNSNSSLVRFCRNTGLNTAYVTSRTLIGSTVVDGIRVNIVPAGLYCLTEGELDAEFLRALARLEGP